MGQRETGSERKGWDTNNARKPYENRGAAQCRRGQGYRLGYLGAIPFTALKNEGGEAMELVRYDSMCRAIDAAYEVDEAKDIRDQAIALEVYAHQAHNVEAERRACEIRLRAERKAGTLSAALEKGAGRPSKIIGVAPKITKADTLHAAGISNDQARKWEKLAAVPAEQFEQQLADPIQKPTTNGIIRAAAEPKPQPVSKDAIWLWGRLLDFERLELLPRSPADVMATMTPEMLDDVHTLAPRVTAWLQQIGKIQ